MLTRKLSGPGADRVGRPFLACPARLIAAACAVAAIGVTVLGTDAAYAAGGTSNQLLNGQGDLQRSHCNGVNYPVLTSARAYTTNAGDPQALQQGVRETVSATNLTSTTDSVSDTTGWNAGFDIGGQLGEGMNVGKGSVSFSRGASRTVTNGTTHSFSTTTSFAITAKRSDMTVTPVYVKEQQWADYYSCSGGALNRQTTNAIHNDVVLSDAWLFSCGNGSCTAGKDYLSG